MSFRTETSRWSLVLIIGYLTSVAGRDEDSPCRQGWIPLEKRCVHVGQNPLWTHSAEDYCKSLHPEGKLISIHSSEEQNFVLQILRNSKRDSLWIGMSYTGRSSSPYTWDDGSDVKYSNWVEPPKDDRFASVAVYAPDGKWYATRDTGRKAPLCEAPALPETSKQKCEAPYENFTRTDSLCYLLVTEKKTWQEAQNHCESLGSHLLSIKSPEENRKLWLNRVLRSIPNLWLGLRSSKGKRFSQWTDLSPAYYFNWGSNEPLQTHQDRCVSFSIEAGSWFVSPCEEKREFICHHKPLENSWKIDPAGNGTCPSDEWMDFGGIYCYFFGRHEKTTWFDANQRCLQINANLLCVHSEQENDVISRSLKAESEPWIGLLNTFHSGMKWSDWTPVDYEKPFTYPNYFPTFTRCGSLSAKGKWTSEGCYDTPIREFICKIKKKE